MSVLHQIYGYNGTNSHPIRIDSSTRALNVIDYTHHEIHAGAAYFAFHTDASKGDGDTINIYFKTPAETTSENLLCHVVVEWAASGAAFLNIYEAPTVTSGTGTNGNDVIDRNRNLTTSSTLSGVQDNMGTSSAAGAYAKDVTVTDNGTLIYQDYAGTGKSSAASERAEEEIVLASDTEYVFEVESDAAGLTLFLRVDWYEHEDLAA